MKAETAIAGALIVVGFCLLAAATTIWSGYVLSYLWLWFAVPLFGLPALGTVQAIGVVYVVGFLTARAPHRDPQEGDTARAISFGIMHPAVALGVGYIVKSFL